MAVIILMIITSLLINFSTTLLNISKYNPENPPPARHLPLAHLDLIMTASNNKIFVERFDRDNVVGTYSVFVTVLLNWNYLQVCSLAFMYRFGMLGLKRSPSDEVCNSSKLKSPLLPDTTVLQSLSLVKTNYIIFISKLANSTNFWPRS